MAGIAPAMATDLAAPDSHKGARVAVGAPPGQDIAVCRLDDGEDVTGALVGHCGLGESTLSWLVVSESPISRWTRGIVTYQTRGMISRARGIGIVSITGDVFPRVWVATGNEGNKIFTDEVQDKVNGKKKKAQ